jgi:hypothetical protein
MPPGTFEVEDPNKVCVLALGYNVDADIYSNWYSNWELGSVVSRPAPAKHLLV